MKNKKKLLIVGGCVVGVILVIVLLIVLMPNNGTDSKTPETTETSDVNAEKEVTIEDPSKSSDPMGKTTDESKKTTKDEETSVIEPDGKGLTPVEEKKPEQGKQSTDTKKKTGKVDEPVKEAEPPKQEEPGSGGIVIGGNTPEPYDCGTPGHHCDGPETHAYVLNLELGGCPYCGKHDCPSFYATDEWGQTCYTPSKCPSYDVHSDPVYYCQKCGKPCGDGSNGTCAEYNIDIDCPLCGEHVEAWTCHSCK